MAQRGPGVAVWIVLGFLAFLVLGQKKASPPGPSGPVPVEIALAELIATGHIVLVTQFNPTTGLFEAFVPGLPGNTLAVIRPNIPIFVSLSVSHTVLSSGISYFIPANTPTEVAVGTTVSITLVS